MKNPVALRTDNRYYLREGTSTYGIDNEEQLREIMESRNFSQFNVTPPVSSVENEDNDAGSGSQAENTSPETTNIKGGRSKNSSAEAEEKIATSCRRSNITENWVEGYGVDTCCFLRIYPTGEFSRLEDVEWEDGLLTLAIHEDERDGNLVVVYEDGEVTRIPISKILKMPLNVKQKMLAGKRPVFVSPARRNDALLTSYHDRGKRYLRLDDIASISEGKMNAKGERVTDAAFEVFGGCEIISPEHHKSLKRIHNMPKKNLGLQLSGVYGSEELRLLEFLGIEV